jgi:two-component system nitrate/nitrite response regulator NarL
VSLIRVLVIDDNADWRAHAESVLNSRGLMEIDTASTGLDGVRKAAALKPDLVVLGIGLTDVSGLEAARRIRSVSPQSRLLLVSAHEDPGVIAAAAAIVRCAFAIKSRADYELPLAVTLAILDQLPPRH